MAYYVFDRHGLQHGLIHWDFVVVLVVEFILEVVDDRDLRRVVLEHELGGHRGDERA